MNRVDGSREVRNSPTAAIAGTDQADHLGSENSSGKKRVRSRLNRSRKKIRVKRTGPKPRATSTEIPKHLIGPSPIVPIRIEGVYTKALLDSGAQVTLLYRDFYEKHLRHLPLKALKDLEIWGIGTESLPYDGYLQVKLDLGPEVTGQPRSCEALAIVCPRPTGDHRGGSMIVGTNTDLVRRLLTPVILEEGHTGELHPMLRPVYNKIAEERLAPSEVGRVWRLGGPRKVLQVGEVARLQVSVRTKGLPSGPYVLLETDPTQGGEAGLEIVPEVIPTKVLQQTRGRVSVDVCNVSTSPVILRARAPIGQVVSATPLLPNEAKESKRGPEIPEEKFFPKDAPISAEWKKRLQTQVLKWRELFSRDEFDVGLARSTEHRIRLQEDKPFRERSRRVPLGDLDDLREQLNELQRTKVIKESRSPYASPIVLVRKKNGSIRLCIDYRTLNRRTIPDQYATPRIEDALQCLSGAKWFSVLDLRSGYHQIPMHPDDKEKTAFICPLGFFEFNRMPQGLTGAPATFQRLMEKTVGDMNLIEVLVYLDDIIVFGKTLEEHEQRLEKVLKRLHEEGLKLSLEKCQFCLPSVTYLGHVVSAEGVSTDPRKLEAVTSWPRPRTVTEVRSFLGFCSYYRRFVEGFARIAKPLNELLQNGETKVEQKTPSQSSPVLGQRKAHESVQEEWTDRCESAFKKLKESLTRAPVLAYADPKKPYELHVDASREGLGGVLYQEHDGLLRPVAYVSRSLTPSEKNYPTHKLEFLALKWAVVDKLKDYLYGAEFVIKTDNNPLTYILTTAKLDATGHRWLAALSGFRFSLKYRPGVNNRDADALSRRPYHAEWTQLTPDGVQAVCQGAEYRVGGRAEAEAIGVMAAAVPELYCYPAQLRDEDIPTFSEKDLQTEQAEDPLIALVRKALNEGKRELLLASRLEGARLAHKEWERLTVQEGVVYRRVPSKNQEEVIQLFLPEKHRERVLRSLHDDHGHLGAEKTFKLVRDRFYWPGMRAEVEGYCHSCLRCIQRKTLPARAAPLGHLQSQGPMDLVCIDFLCLEPDTSSQGNILVVTDHFTRYAQAFPTKDQRAPTVAKVLMEKFFVHYGLPKRIHSDQGRDFESRLVGQLLRSLGIQKTRTTPYHPQGDAQPERFNRTLLNMLGTLSVREKQSWSRQVATLVHAYNSTENDSTGYSPYRLMFGREARLPVDLAFGMAPDRTSVNSHRGYVDRLRKNLASAFEQARQASENREQRNKRNYDLKVRVQDLQPGDKVLLKNLGVPARHKLADRWSSQIYIVCKQLSGLPVYQIRPDGRAGPLKNWHRNHLLPLGEAVRIPVGDEALAPSLPAPCPPPHTRSQQARGGDAGEDDSEEENLCLDWVWPTVSQSENSTSSLGERRVAGVPVGDETPPSTLPYPHQPPYTRPQQAREVETGRGDHGGRSSCPAREQSSESDRVSQVRKPWESDLQPEAPEFRLEDSSARGVPLAEEDVLSEHDSMPSLEGSYEEEEGTTAPVDRPCDTEGMDGDDTPTSAEGLPEEESTGPKRSIRPPRRLTYDFPGHSTEETVTTVTRVPRVSTMLMEAIDLLERLERACVKLGYVIKKPCT